MLLKFGCWLFVFLVGAFVVMASDEEVLEEDEWEYATFAGGCFWCMEPPFDNVRGVLSVTSGYIGGVTSDPYYEEVSQGGSGHCEAIQILFDSGEVSYEQLLYIFWRNIDPTVKNRQFCDVGDQYRTAIFYHSEEQEKLAKASKEELLADERFETIETEITKATKFFAAEGYHQDYSKKNPLRYKFYRYSCGRDDRLRELWGEEAGGH